MRIDALVVSALALAPAFVSPLVSPSVSPSVPALALALATRAGPAPTRAQERTVVVGSKNFTESALLGEMMALVIDAHTDLDAEHKSGMGGTLVCFTALESGGLDAYAEYSGTGWSTILRETERVNDPLRAFLSVQARFRERYDLEWLQPFGFDNTYALAMDASRAEALGVRTISDLARVGADLRAGFSIEFMNREDGWPGLAAHYGLAFAETRAMEHALAYEAVASGAIDLVDAYSTDAKLLRYELRVLEDDRRFFPPYDAAPLVRAELLRAHPEVRSALERLAYRLPASTMTELNHRVEEGGASFAAVARDFLADEGLLSTGAGQERAERRRKGFVAFFLGRWRTTLALLWEHVLLTGAAVLLAALFAVPLGVWITRHRTAERVSLAAAGALQTIPSLALLAFMIAIPGLGLSVRSAIVALFLYALLPILRNTHTGLVGVDRQLVDAARGMGLEPRQVLLRIRLPLAVPTIMAGLRTATVISVGVATLAAFIGAGGLGEPIVTGLYLNDPHLILSGALPAALLALASDHLLGRLQRALTPRGMRAVEARAG